MAGTRKIAAILVADVVGYSRLAGADEDRTLARLRALRSDLIDPTIAVYNGRIFKRTGDGSLVEFRSVVDAVRCAIEVQNGLIERNAGLPPERRIEFRVGIHLGDVVEESDGDLMGDGVNIAARLEGICGPGAICLSEDAYRQVKGRLDLAITDLGPTQLKNIAEPVRVYSLEVGKPAQVKPPPPKRRSALTPLAAGIAVLFLLIAAGAWHLFIANRPAVVATTATVPAPSNPPPPLAAQRFSIVVLPFANLSGDPSQDYLADALTDELTTSIARIPSTFVIARNTAFTYKGRPVDAKAIGKDLGVRYVLEGSVQPSAAEVRVNAQLIDADSGAHVWAEQFDTPRADVLQTQDEIVAHLAHTLLFQLPEADLARLMRKPGRIPTPRIWLSSALRPCGKPQKLSARRRKRVSVFASRRSPSIPTMFLPWPFCLSGTGSRSLTRSAPTRRLTSSAAMNWCRKRSPSIQRLPTGTSSRLRYSETRGALTKPTRRPSAQLIWIRPPWTPTRNWPSTNWSSGNTIRALKILTRPFGSVLTIHLCIIGMRARRSPISS